jgi:antitoxin (DNA-binding transcriptional repressor) of toxin-antitoxin stability system
MERANAGTEILIRRRGHPYARLGPARLKSSASPADE